MPVHDPGPISQEPDCFGQTVPFYALTFDKKGNCTSPQSLDHMISKLAAGEFSDLILFSHGWNNEFATAKARYLEFLKGVSDTAASYPGRLPDGFRPVFAGIYWPSAALTWPWDKAPDIAAAPGHGDGEDVLELQELLDDADRKTFDELLAGKNEIDSDTAARLAELLAPKLLQIDDVGDVPGTFTARDLLQVWRHAPLIASVGDGTGEPTGVGFEDFGGVDTSENEVGPEVAGLTDRLSVRRLLRLTTVLMMKDRAGIVGAADVAKTVRCILDETHIRLHLVGHSYGAKVVLTSLVKAGASRPAETVFLLQPAVSNLCMAADVGDGRAGGFRPALNNAVKPIFSTYSSHDFPLRHVFQLAARRRSDIGELQTLGAPSKYAALGGYGPSGLLAGEVSTAVLPAPGQPYGNLEETVEILALDGGSGIDGHSDVTNPYTFWAMFNLLT